MLRLKQGYSGTWTESHEDSLELILAFYYIQVSSTLMIKVSWRWWSLYYWFKYAPDPEIRKAEGEKCCWNCGLGCCPMLTKWPSIEAAMCVTCSSTLELYLPSQHKKKMVAALFLPSKCQARMMSHVVQANPKLCWEGNFGKCSFRLAKLI